MHSPTASLAWELWRKNRVGILILLGLLPCGLLIRLINVFLPSQTVTLGLCASAMLVTFLALCGIFSCADGGAQVAYPLRAFTLPVSTSRLVHVPILLGALVIGLLHLAWVYLVLLPLGAGYRPGAFTVFWIAALLAFQACVWCLANYPTLMMAALVLLAAGLMRLAVMLSEPAWEPYAMVCLCGLIAISYSAAWLGIAGQRRGQWHIPGGPLARTFLRAGASLRSKRLLRTPARAQLWMEWRRNAVGPLVAAGLIMALMLWSLRRLVSSDDFLPGSILSVWLFFFSSAVTYWAAMSGVLLVRDASSNSFSISPFLAARPISSGELAWAKIKLSFGLTAIGWLIYGLGVFAWGVHIGRHRALREDEIQVIILVALGLSWHVIGGLPCWLAGRIPSAGVAGLLLIGGYIALGNTIRFFSEHIGLLRGLLELLLIFGFAAKTLLAAWGFRRCYVRHLLRGRAILSYALIWTFGTACFVAVAMKFAPAAQIPTRFAIWTAALLFPLARIALAPLGVAAGRHR